MMRLLTSHVRALQSCGIGRLRSRHAGFALLMSGLALASLSAIAEGAGIESVLSPMPLVLKDGRIARVSVHTVPFLEDAATPSTAIAEELAAFTRDIATDCFLTAQAIGHVGKKETRGHETADIHRLARARADAIQGSLTEYGLPAGSIASVWDWRFMVQDARVTLWVFRLAAGDDCRDEPMSPDPSSRVASTTRENASASVNGDGAGNQAMVADTLPRRSGSAEPQVVPMPLARPATAAVEQLVAAATAEAGLHAEAGQAIKPAAAPASRDKQTSPLAATSKDMAAIDGAGRAAIGEDGALEIIFATNSSYFPEGAGGQLRALLSRLEKGAKYEVSVQTSVDSGIGVVGASSADEAARYNRWLAQRRFERVKSWLLDNAGSSRLQIEPSLLENDDSRRVRIELRPLG